ncbi:MAG TPA: DNA primase small subunit domain-containing protein [Candidatus Nanoarchaeia archaeon]|nr:DNA primase small subunit domain-containing protein [Candidatus Nanoarchaeia archaeon]
MAGADEKKPEEKPEEGRDNDEKKEISEAEKRIRQIALSYYSRQDVQDAIFDFSKDREVVPRYFEGFGRRPDSLQYKSDMLEMIRKGATSLHCSEELWHDALQLSTEMDAESLNSLRKGWDLLIDIDSKYLDYSRIAAQLIVEALGFHGVKNAGVKFSGNKGFHLIVPWQAFPEEINNVKTSSMFPEWPRIITKYLNELIKKQLVERISEMTTGKTSKYIKGEEEVGDAVKKVMPDLVLVSPRHLFRMPYSLHEKTCLSSVVVPKEKLLNFSPNDANPLKIKPMSFMPKAEKGEARELLIQALDWNKESAGRKPRDEKGEDKREYSEVILRDVKEEMFPPCVKKILEGMKDGRKRALFILINFFRSLSLEQKDIEKRIDSWNKKNPKPLAQNYVSSQLSWHFRQKRVLPPNCDKDYYNAIFVCEKDEFCSRIKNPVNYTIKKYKAQINQRRQ